MNDDTLKQIAGALGRKEAQLAKEGRNWIVTWAGKTYSVPVAARYRWKRYLPTYDPNAERRSLYRIVSVRMTTEQADFLQDSLGGSGWLRDRVEEAMKKVVDRRVKS